MGRKWLVMLHVVTSVGLIGTVAVFVLLSVIGLTANDPQQARAAYWAGDLVTRSLVVPLALAGILTGIALSLLSTWGLLRHHWVAAKFWLGLGTIAVLAVHLGPVALMANTAWRHDLQAGEMVEARAQLILASSGGLLVLLGMTLLSVFKPAGLTRRGWNAQKARRSKGLEPTSSRLS